MTSVDRQPQGFARSERPPALWVAGTAGALGGGMLGGAAVGAAAGTMFGPPGTFIGSGIGAAVGTYLGQKTGDDHHEPQRAGEGAYEHPALEPEPGYRAGRWAEFKRLFALSWNNGYTKETVILCAVVWVVTLFGMTFLRWR